MTKHGRVFKTHLFGLPGYAVTDFETFQMIYDGSHKTTKQFFPDSFVEVSACVYHATGFAVAASEVQDDMCLHLSKMAVAVLPNWRWHLAQHLQACKGKW